MTTEEKAKAYAEEIKSYHKECGRESLTFNALGYIIKQAYLAGAAEALRWRDVKTDPPQKDGIVWIASRNEANYQVSVAVWKDNQFHGFGDVVEPKIWVALPPLPNIEEQ